jgi:AraC-like DNA-binding protein
MSKDVVHKSPPMVGLPREAAGGARVNVQWFDRKHERALMGPHGHRFLELVYFERDGEQHSVGASTWEVCEGDLYLILPGEVHNVREIGEAEGWAVEFAADVVGGMRVRNEPLLAEVFAYVEKHYAEPISLANVAEAVSLSSGYLTTVVRRRTGRTVVEWIAERRMAEARRLLVETDESIEWIGAGVGYDDPTYFARRFRRAHGVTPAAWRNANCSL